MHSLPNDKAIARKRLTNYEASREFFIEHRAELYAAPKRHKFSLYIASVTKPLRNVTRLPGDFWHLLKSIGKSGILKDQRISATVLPRDAFFHNGKLKRLFATPSNVKPLRALLEYELYKEVNAEHFLMIEGVSLTQFHALLSKLGCQITAFLADDRGENAGRLAINHASLQLQPWRTMPHNDPDTVTEQQLWGRIFSRLHWLPWIKSWGMSRTHSAMYCTKDNDEQDIIFLPIHVDPNSPFVAIRDLLERFVGKPPVHGALAYHRAALENDSRYVGTGLYDLGISVFLSLLTQAQQLGHIAHLTIQGEELLQTSGSIVKDDRSTWHIKSMLNSQ